MTIQQHASFDSSAAELNATSKLVKAWESKNAKNAAKAGGVSLMALSLAACGGSSTTVTTPVVDAPAVDTPTTPVNQSLTLTTGIDTLVGGAGDDTFMGTSGGTAPTIIAGDSVDGGAGSDTVLVSSSGTTTVTAGLTMTNVETVRVVDTASTGSTVNLAGTTGVDTLESFGSTGAALTFSNVAEVATLSLNNTAGAHATTVAYTTTTGTQNQDVTLNSAKATGNITVAGVEELDVTASGESTGTFVMSSLTTATVNASDATTIDLDSASNTKLTSVDASASTGAVTLKVDYDLGVDALEVTGGSGADVFTITAGALGTGDTLDGGDGDDTMLWVSTGAADVTSVAAAAATISNVEILSLTASDGANDDAFTIDMDNVEGVTSVKVKAEDTDAANVFTLNDMTVAQAGAVTVNYKAAATGATVDLDIKTDTTADAAEVNVNAVTGSTTTIQDSADTMDSLTVNVAGNIATTTIVIDAADFDTALTVTGGVADKVLDMDNTAITSDSIDFSGVVANSKIQLGADTHTVVMGSGDDQVDFNQTYTNADSVDGGDGSDTVMIELTGSLSAAPNLTNVEDLRLASTPATATANVAGIDTVTIIDTDTAANSAVTDVLNLLAFDGSSLNFANANGAGAQILNAVTLTSSFGGTADTLSMSFDGTSSASADVQMSVGDININGVETLNVSIADIGTSLTLGNGTADGIAGTSLKTVTITGGDAGIAYDLGDIVGLSTGKITSVDMAGLTGNTTVEISGLDDGAIVNIGTGTNAVVATAGSANTTGVTINGGTGADTITGTTLADTIFGGAGIDTIAGNGGADTVTAGSGADKVNFATALTDTDGDGVADATITLLDFVGGSSGDVLQFDDDIFAGNAVGVNSGDVTLVSVALAETLDGTNVGLGSVETSTNYVIYDTAANIAAATIFVEDADDVLIGIASDTGAIYALTDTDDGGSDTDANIQVGALASGYGDLVAANIEIIA